jgi:hypothetical protein
MRNAWSWYWAAWIVVGFAIPETIALIANPDNTLSDQVWRWFGVQQGASIWHWSVLHIALLGFMVWLTIHFAWGIWR